MFLLIAILHYTICHGFFNRGDGQGSSGIAGFGTRSGYRGAGEPNLSHFSKFSSKIMTWDRHKIIKSS